LRTATEPIFTDVAGSTARSVVGCAVRVVHPLRSVGDCIDVRLGHAFELWVVLDLPHIYRCDGGNDIGSARSDRVATKAVVLGDNESTGFSRHLRSRIAWHHC